MCDMTINIYGGNNQILPNATEAVQTSMSMIMPTNCRSSRLPATLFLPRQKSSLATSTRTTSRSISTRFARATTPPIWPRSSSPLLDQESKLTEETIVKESFIQCLLPFAINITAGRSVNNIRARINDALEARHRSRP